jgi:hypothetical protein
MKRSTFNDLSLNEMFAIINRLQSENTKQKSELLAAQQKIATYEDAIGTEQEAQLAKQAAIIEGQSNAITFEELTAGAPVDDFFAPDSVL